MSAAIRCCGRGHTESVSEAEKKAQSAQNQRRNEFRGASGITAAQRPEQPVGTWKLPIGHNRDSMPTAVKE
jgi:hypothetical protein